MEPSGPTDADFFQAIDKGEKYDIPRQIYLHDLQGNIDESQIYNLREDGVVIAIDAKVEETAELRQRTVMKSQAYIGKYAVIGSRATVGEGSRIKKYAKIGDRTSIGDNVTVGPRSVVEDFAVVRENTSIGKFSTIGEGAIISRNVEIGDRVTVVPNTLVRDGKVIVSGARYLRPKYSGRHERKTTERKPSLDDKLREAGISSSNRSKPNRKR